MRTRESIEQLEKKILAPYASCAVDSRGRVYPTSPHPLRTAFQRDRDRIIHSTAFRRMEYKTQVFIPHETDHYRTRLTHTIEVAQISRTLARTLQLNEDLAEAIALVHDVGHTPFGHSGEDVLSELLKEFGGFNHNRQSLRIVDKLEQRYSDHPGLNLSYEVREGIVKHETKNHVIPQEFHPEEHTSLEASLVDVADEIAYNAHDMDDGLSSGIITPDDLRKLGFWKYLQLGKLVENFSIEDDRQRYTLVRSILDFMATDLVNETKLRLVEHKIKSVDDVRTCKIKLCAYSDANSIIVYDLKQFLNEKLYKHPKLLAMADWSEEILVCIYNKLYNDTNLLPQKYQTMLEHEKKEIVISDYIAGMTDRYAVAVYDKFQ